MNLAQKTIRETSGSVLLGNLAYGIRFGTQILLARLLSPEIFGIVTLATAILGFLNIISNWGINVAVMQERKKRKKLTDTLFTLTFFYSLIALLVFSGVLLFLRRFYSPQTIQVAFLLLIPNLLAILSTVSKGVMQKEIALMKMGGIKLVSILFASLVGIIGAFKGWGIWSLAGFYGIEKFLSSGIFLLLSSYRPKLELSRQQMEWFFSFGKKIFQSSILEKLFNKGDDIIVGSTLSSATLGFYNMAWKLTRVFHTAVAPYFNKGVLASFSRKEIPTQKKAVAFNFTSRVLVRSTLLFYLFLAIFSPEIISLLLGKQWLKTTPLVLGLIPWGIVLPFFALNKHFHLSLGKPQNFLRVLKWMALLFVIIFPAGVYFFGGEGAVLSLDLIYLFGSVLIYRKTRKILGIKKIEGFISIFAISFICSGLVFLLKKRFLQNLGELSVVALGGIFYLFFWSFLSLIFDRKLKQDLAKITKSF